MNKLKQAVSHSNLKFAPWWSFTGQIISNVLSHSRTGFIWLQNTPYMQIISKSQVTFLPLCSLKSHQLSVSFLSCYRKDVEWTLSFYPHLEKIFTFPLRPGGQKQNQRVLPQVHGGRRCQDPFKIRTTLTQASLLFPLATEKLRQKLLLGFGLNQGRPSFLTFFPSFFIAVTWDGQPWHHSGKNRTGSCSIQSLQLPSNAQMQWEGVEPGLPQASACHLLLRRRPSSSMSSSHRCWWSCCGCWERDPVWWCGEKGSAAFDWIWSPGFFLFCPCSLLVVIWRRGTFIIPEFQMLWWLFSL